MKWGSGAHRSRPVLKNFAAREERKEARDMTLEAFLKKDGFSEGIFTLPEEWSTRETLTILEEGEIRESISSRRRRAKTQRPEERSASGWSMVFLPRSQECVGTGARGWWNCGYDSFPQEIPSQQREMTRGNVWNPWPQRKSEFTKEVLALKVRWRFVA